MGCPDAIIKSILKSTPIMVRIKCDIIMFYIITNEIPSYITRIGVYILNSTNWESKIF